MKACGSRSFFYLDFQENLDPYELHLIQGRLSPGANWGSKVKGPKDKRLSHYDSDGQNTFSLGGIFLLRFGPGPCCWGAFRMVKEAGLRIGPSVEWNPILKLLDVAARADHWLLPHRLLHMVSRMSSWPKDHYRGGADHWCRDRGDQRIEVWYSCGRIH